MGNALVVTLTLVSPRLWIIIKHLMTWVYRNLKVTSRVSQSEQPRSEHIDLMVISTSRSELGAARDLFINALQNGTNHQEVDSDLLIKARWLPTFLHAISCTQPFSGFYRNFKRKASTIVISLFFSVICAGIFVAESSGSVLSANIVSGTMALSASSNCSMRRRGSLDRAAAYQQKCYGKSLGSDGCNYFYNQTISYTEQTSNTSPFIIGKCPLKEGCAHTFDTGYIDSKYIGINAARRHYFRRRTTCAPLLPDGKVLRERTWGSFHRPNDTRDKHQLGLYLLGWSAYEKSPGLFMRLDIPRTTPARKVANDLSGVQVAIEVLTS